MKELELTLLVRNNRLKQRRKESGLTLRQMGNSVGGVYGYAALESMRASPRKDGEWTPLARRIADFHCTEPEDLWPEEVLQIAPPTRAVRTIDVADMGLLLGEHSMRALEAPGALHDGAELHYSVSSVLSTLTPREEKILRMRFGIGEKGDHTLKEIGRDDGASVERIRQLEMKALSKLRQPVTASRLKSFVNADCCESAEIIAANAMVLAGRVEERERIAQEQRDAMSRQERMVHGRSTINDLIYFVRQRRCGVSGCAFDDLRSKYGEWPVSEVSEQMMLSAYGVGPVVLARLVETATSHGLKFMEGR